VLNVTLGVRVALLGDGGARDYGRDETLKNELGDVAVRGRVDGQVPQQLTRLRYRARISRQLARCLGRKRCGALGRRRARARFWREDGPPLAK
jgi:hypothetical protein